MNNTSCEVHRWKLIRIFKTARDNGESASGEVDIMYVKNVETILLFQNGGASGQRHHGEHACDSIVALCANQGILLEKSCTKL